MWPVEPLKCTAWQTVKKSESYNMILKSKPTQIECNIKPILNSCLHLQSITLLPVLRRSVWKEQQQRPQSLLPEIRASQRKVKKAGKQNVILGLVRWLEATSLQNTTWVRCTRSYEGRREPACSSCSLTSTRVPTQEHLSTLSLTLIYTLINTHACTHAQLIN